MSPSPPRPTEPAAADSPGSERTPCARALTVLIPVHNEEAVLPATLDRLREHFDGLSEDYELLCVDDGSTDATARIVRERAEEDPRVRLVRLEHNRGKGGALRRGVAEASGELILMLDADLSTELASAAEFLAALRSGSSLVLGDRRAPGACIGRRQPLLRQSLGHGFALLARGLIHPGVRDFTCGFKGLRRETARELFAAGRIDGWAYDAEIMAIARARGVFPTSLPVRWNHSPGSKVRMPGALLEAGRDLVRIWLALRRGVYDAPRPAGESPTGP